MIARHGVQNERTRMVIWQAAREPAISPTREDGYREYLPPDEGFFALLGSVNGSSTMRMLIDHKGRIGYKTVMKIIVFGCNSAADTGDFRKHRTFMIVLSNEQKPIELELPQATVNRVRRIMNRVVPDTASSDLLMKAIRDDPGS